MTKLIVAILGAFLVGCATTDVQQILGTPSAVGLEVNLLGIVVKAHVSDTVKAAVHGFAVKLKEAASLDTTYLFSLLPADTGSQSGNFLIGKVKETITYFVNKYGASNQTTLSYAHSIADNLLLNF